MRVRRAVIPAAGFGTRMLPAAKAVPKELLPVLDRPVIQYVVEEAATGGVEEVVLVNSPEKMAIEAHFRPTPELNERLRVSGREELLASVNELSARVRISVAYQHEQRGLGHAVLQARRLVGDEPFLCLLGDTIFSISGCAGQRVRPAEQLARAYERFGTSIIGLEEVPPEKVERYGIVGGTMIEPGVLKLDTLVEKPAREKAPSHFAIAARYVLSPAIFDCIECTPAGKGGEIQLTDALKLLLEREPIHGVVLGAKRHDIGNPLDWLKTNIALAARDEKLWDELRPMLRSLLANENQCCKEIEMSPRSPK